MNSRPVHDRAVMT